MPANRYYANLFQGCVVFTFILFQLHQLLNLVGSMKHAPPLSGAPRDIPSNPTPSTSAASHPAQPVWCARSPSSYPTISKQQFADTNLFTRSPPTCCSVHSAVFAASSLATLSDSISSRRTWLMQKRCHVHQRQDEKHTLPYAVA